MRFDLYTSEDRAREALVVYRTQQRTKYMSWVTAGALIIAVLLCSIAFLVAPDYISRDVELVNGARHN